ncbi:sigma-70 family RNA polymerase sigma factor [Solibacillus sp. FSL K6-1523]|uniref:sigma-70 family RNA polymerase sigma factor n=1 Tax=Solibacillus sp. FSL K6-1523 TaxID=2921471 RepID=UPI0030F91770
MEQDLVKRAIRGNQEAILQLIEKDEEIFYRMAFTYVKNEHDALDVMQDFTYKVLKKMHTVKNPDYARTWLVRVLIHSCIDFLRKRPQTMPLEEQHLIENAVHYDVERMLTNLTLNEQQIMYLKYYEQRKNKEIAEIQQIPEGTVKSKIHHILLKLRKHAGEREDWL